MNTFLRFQPDWADPPGDDRDAGTALAWGTGILYIAGAPAWFTGSPDAPKPVTWSWIELLEFLASRWLHLTTEQAYPFGITVENPRDFRARARQVIESRFYTDSSRDDADEEVFRFEGRHDLARALRGISLPSVFLLREGTTVLVSTERSLHAV